MCLAPLPPHHQTRVVRRRRNHCQDLSRGGFESHNGTDLPFEQPLAESLEIEIDTQGEVLSCYWSRVQLPILIASLDSSMGIAEHDLHSLDTTELFLVGSFHA